MHRPPARVPGGALLRIPDGVTSVRYRAPLFVNSGAGGSAHLFRAASERLSRVLPGGRAPCRAPASSPSPREPTPGDPRNGEHDVPLPSPVASAKLPAMARAHIAGFEVGEGRPLLLMCGPDVVEGEEITLRAAQPGEGDRRPPRPAPGLQVQLRQGQPHLARGLPRAGHRRGPARPAGSKRERAAGAHRRARAGAGARPAAEVADVLQVPAFLCRQTDLLVACGRSGPRGQRQEGPVRRPAGHAARAGQGPRAAAAPTCCSPSGARRFGYNNLVVDMRSLADSCASWARRCASTPPTACSCPSAAGDSTGGRAPVRAAAGAGGGGGRRRRPLPRGPRGPRPGPLRRAQLARLRRARHRCSARSWPSGGRWHEARTPDCRSAPRRVRAARARRRRRAHRRRRSTTGPRARRSSASTSRTATGWCWPAWRACARRSSPRAGRAIVEKRAAELWTLAVCQGHREKRPGLRRAAGGGGGAGRRAPATSATT